MLCCVCFGAHGSCAGMSQVHACLGARGSACACVRAGVGDKVSRICVSSCLGLDHSMCKSVVHWVIPNWQTKASASPGGHGSACAWARNTRCHVSHLCMHIDMYCLTAIYPTHLSHYAAEHRLEQMYNNTKSSKHSKRTITLEAESCSERIASGLWLGGQSIHQTPLLQRTQGHKGCTGEAVSSATSMAPSATKSFWRFCAAAWERRAAWSKREKTCNDIWLLLLARPLLHRKRPQASSQRQQGL